MCCNEPITWDDVAGLDDRQRALGQMIFPDADLRMFSLAGLTVNG